MNAVNIGVFFFLVHVTRSQTPDLCSGENADLPCTLAKHCPWFVKQRQIYSDLPKNTPARRKKLVELKSKVCNIKPNKVCCPLEVVATTTRTTTTTTTTPPPRETPPSETPPRETPPSNTRRSVPNTSPSWVPSGRNGECGLDIYSEFIIGGNITKLGEHPWAVLLGKPSGKQSSRRSHRKIKWKCGGTLINRWYVVSAAHCSPSQIKMVRVGEWRVVDTSKPLRRKGLKFSSSQRCCRCSNFRLVNGTYDCMANSNGAVQFVWPQDVPQHSSVCAPPHQDIKVDRIMKHPNYRRLPSGLVVNDILLVKLRHIVLLSDYVQPACLPTGYTLPLLQHLGETPREAMVVGWGKTYDGDYNETDTVASAFQQKLTLRLVKNEDCSAIWSTKYNTDLSRVIRQRNHICAGGKRGEDSCKGDSGGPLLFRESDGDPTYLVGVVSAGTNRCGVGVPAIFSRVTSAVDWIIDNIN